jgi:hypothetical protein
MLTQTSLRSCSQWFCFRALKLDAYYTNAFVARAQVYQKKNEYDRALRKYDEVIGILSLIATRRYGCSPISPPT